MKCSDIIKMQLDCFYEDNKNMYVIQEIEQKKLFKNLNAIDLVFNNQNTIEVWVDEMNMINVSIDVPEFDFSGNKNIIDVIKNSEKIIIGRSNDDGMINVCFVYNSIWVEK